MFRFIRRRLPHIHISSAANTNPTPLTFFLLFQQIPSSPKPFSTSPTNNPAQGQTSSSSFTVSYLRTSCGLSLDLAVSLSHRIRLQSAEKPDAVLTLLRNHGFTQTQIKTLIAKRPLLLVASPEKTILPKLQYFQDLGIPTQMITKFFSSAPILFSRGIHTQIIPYVDFIRAYVKSNEDIMVNIYRMACFFISDFKQIMESNIKILQDHGVPEFLITKLLVNSPSVLVTPSERFKEQVSRAEQLGFPPSTQNFILAIRSFTLISKSKWERRRRVYLSLGWSENEFLSAFRLQPMLMSISDKKIRDVMSFFIDEMDWKPSYVARNPCFLMLSLEKRTMPRCLVLQILSSKGIVKKKYSFSHVMRLSEKEFIKKFVIKYQEEVPEILGVHVGKVKNSSAEESKTMEL